MHNEKFLRANHSMTVISNNDSSNGDWTLWPESWFKNE